LFWQPNENCFGNATRRIHFDIHAKSVNALQTKRTQTGKHSTILFT
jgi:hypothetical protein